MLIKIKNLFTSIIMSLFKINRNRNLVNKFLKEKQLYF
jgi:hypothetical protein